MLGLILSFGIMAISSGANPFAVFGTMMSTAFAPGLINYTLSITGLLLVAGLANAIAFKTGLFNIGVSGQMFFSGAMAVLLGLTVFKDLGVLGLVLLV
jgi:simple sugar transport system permease protein